MFNNRKIGFLNPIQNLIVLFFLVGYPKDPFYGIPLGLIIFFVFFKKLLSRFLSSIGQIQLLFTSVFILFSLLRVLIEGHDPLQDFVFILVLAYKSLVGVLIAYSVFELITEKYKYLYFYIIFQLVLIILSAYSTEVYNFLLLFQTEAAKNVFSNTFGLRSTGFGVIHNEGSTTLVLLYAFLVFEHRHSFFNLISSLLIYCSAYTSRMVFLLIPVIQAFLDPQKLLIAVSIFVILLLFVLDTSTGPLSEVFEFYNVYLETGYLGARSADSIFGMITKPDNLTTWTLGDGKFFEGVGFYMGSDIGFSRVVFFGGLFGLLFYSAMCIWPVCFLLKPFSLTVKNTILLFLILFVFVLSNIKGINIQNWSFILTMLIISERPGLK